MKTLVRQFILLGLLISTFQAYGQCELSGYAICEGADKDTYFINVDASNLTTGDVVSIAGTNMSKVDGFDELTFGPFSHSGMGTAYQEVLVNGAACIEVLETLCGYYTDNGLHASGAGCVNVNNQGEGFILAQSRPGTFNSNDVHKQVYVLADNDANYVDDNMTGLFENLSSDDYNVFAVNVNTDESADFQSGLSSASDLVDYFNSSTSCVSICGNVEVAVGCSSTAIDAFIDPDFEDPCDCRNPLNVFNQDGTIRYMHDVITITQADDMDTWVFRNPTTDFYIQTSPDAFELVTDGMSIPSIGNGMFSIEIYHAPTIGFASDFMATAGPNAGFEITGKSNACTDCIGVQIPTMGQWALLILALVLMNIGLITVYNNREIIA